MTSPLDCLAQAKSFLWRAENADSLEAKEGHLKMAAHMLSEALGHTVTTEEATLGRAAS